MIKACLLLLIAVLSAIPAHCQKDILEGNDSNQMSLLVYVDASGKALVTGYADDISGLGFLSISHYRYQNGSRQLYAVTDSLTSKKGDNWTLRLEAGGRYDEYHAKIFLPGSVKLRKITCSPGLEYFIYNSNDSFVAEVLGYDQQDPDILLDYQIPLVDIPQSSSPASSNPPYLQIIIVLAAAGISIAAILSRRMRPKQEDAVITGPGMNGMNAKEHEMAVTVSEAGPAQHPGAGSTSTEALQPPPTNSWPCQGQSERRPPERIVVTREMAAIIEVLTARERSVLEALINHGGRMSQSEIRYETGTPGSSLTGIIASLERRNIVTKKEWGRTNLIELSKRFMSNEEGS